LPFLLCSALPMDGKAGYSRSVHVDLGPMLLWFSGVDS
jgi:hypothetical protein